MRSAQHLNAFAESQYRKCAVATSRSTPDIQEIDIDDVAWKDDLVTIQPDIKDGRLTIPSGPGWGTELNEDVIAAHPWGDENHGSEW